MERIGPIMLATGCVADVAAGVLWMFLGGDVEMLLGLNSAALAGLLLTFGGAWLAILWGDATRDLLIYCGIAIGAHIVALMGVAFLPLGPIINGLLFLVTALTVGIATVHAWRETGGSTVAH